MTPLLLDTTIDRTADVVTIQIAGEVDLSNVRELQTVLVAAFAAEPSTALVADLSEVRFFCAAGLRVLLNVHNLSIAPLIVVAPSRCLVHRCLSLTGLDKILTVVDSTTEATREISTISPAGSLPETGRMSRGTPLRTVPSGGSPSEWRSG